MTEYPQDIVKAADEVCRAMDIASTPTNCLPIMDAIMAERQRCLDHCDYVRENIRVRKSERKRFDIFDLNMNFKGAVGCVRERIAGDWEKNWKPDPDAPSLEQAQ